MPGRGPELSLKWVEPRPCCYWPSCRMFSKERVIVGPFVTFTNGEYAHLHCHEYAAHRAERAAMRGAGLAGEHKSVFDGTLR